MNQNILLAIPVASVSFNLSHRMKVLIAPDKFKGSLDAIKVCQAIEEALYQSGKQIQCKSIPMADGGEGTCDMLTQFSKGKKIKVQVLDPFFRKIEGEYGISGDGRQLLLKWQMFQDYSC
jgi:glycerate kinase